MPNPEIIDTATALVASLPHQYGQEIPDRDLVVLLVGHAHPVADPLRVLGVYVAELNQCRGCCAQYGDWWEWIDTSSRLGCSAVAVVIDNEADGPGDSGYEHGLLTDRLGLHLHEHGVTLEAVYAARGINPDEPVWSLDTDEFIDTVPHLEPGPGPGPEDYTLQDYALRAGVVERPESPVARLA